MNHLKFKLFIGAIIVFIYETIYLTKKGRKNKAIFYKWLDENYPNQYKIVFKEEHIKTLFFYKKNKTSCICSQIEAFNNKPSKIIMKSFYYSDSINLPIRWDVISVRLYQYSKFLFNG